MKKITKLIQEFISGIDIEDKRGILIAVELAQDTSINSIMVYNSKVSDMDCGLSYKDKNGLKCKLFEIIWQDDNFEFWFCDFILEMKLNHKQNSEIASYLNKTYDKSYNDNYISTIFH